MKDRCEECGERRRDVRWYSYDDDSLPEDIADGYYCTDCFNDFKEAELDDIMSQYCDHNCDDCPSYRGYQCLRGMM